MKRLIILFLALIAINVQAQEPTTTGEIVVTARRTSLPYSELPDNITIITAKDLSLMPVNDLAEALNMATGVDLQPAGHFGYPATVSIQGCNPQHVRLMVDGIMLNSQGRAFGDPSQIPIENVERIEIIKGTGSSAWGSSLGGVINVITKSPSGNRPIQGTIVPSIGWGDYGFNKTTMEASGKIDKFGYIIGASNLDTDNKFRPNSAISSQKFDSKLVYSLSPQLNLEASYHYSGADIGGYEFKDLGYGENLFSFIRYGAFKLSVAPQKEFNVSAAFKFSNQDNKVEQFLLPDKTPIAKNASKDIFTGVDLQSTIMPAKNQTLSLGTDLGRDELNADMMADKETLRRQGYYANYLINLGSMFSISAGERYDKNTSYGDYYSPSAGIVYHLPIAESNLRLSWARAFNAPPLIYKFISGNPFLAPNPNLRAEKSPAVYETGIDAKPIKELWLKFAYYRAEIRDLVDYDFVNGIMANIGRVRRQGMESEVKYTFNKELQLLGGWSLNRIEDLETSTIVQGSGAARVTYNLGLNYIFMNMMTINIKGNYHFWNESIASQPNDRKFIWDTRLNFASGNQSQIFISVTNILDSTHWLNKLLPLPGREMEVGLRYSF